MDIKGENPNIFKPSGEIRDLRLLEELERNPIVSQRELSHKFGIALGVTNACLRRMARKGLIRIRGLNHRKIGYYLTPKGFAEKAKLTLHLISYIVQHYSELKNIISQKLLDMQHDGLQRVVFYGVSDEMEVAQRTREKFKKMLRNGRLNDREVEIETQVSAIPVVEVFSPAGMEEMVVDMALLGVTRVDQIIPTYVCKAAPVTFPHEMSAFVHIPGGQLR